LTGLELPHFIAKKCCSAKTQKIIKRQITALRESGDPAGRDLDDRESLLVLFASTGCTVILKRHLAGCSVCQNACSTHDEHFRNAVHNALIGHWTETAMFLLTLPTALSAGIDIPHKNDMTFLYRAIFFGHTKVVQFLLSHNTDPLIHYPTDNSEYALHLAIDLAAKDIVAVLLRHGQREEQFQLQRQSSDCPGSTALHRALQSEQSRKDKLTTL
jgi:ankyrin repeat protein